MKVKNILKLGVYIFGLYCIGVLYHLYVVERMVQNETNNLSYLKRGVDLKYDDFDFEKLFANAKQYKVQTNSGTVYPFFPLNGFTGDVMAASCKSVGLEYIGHIDLCSYNYLKSQSKNKPRSFHAPIISSFASHKWIYKYREENREYWPDRYKGLSMIKLREVNTEKTKVPWMDTSLGAQKYGVEVTYNILAQWLWGRDSLVLKSLEKLSRITVSTLYDTDLNFETEIAFDYVSGMLVFDDRITQRDRFYINGKDTGISGYCGTTKLESEFFNKRILKSAVLADQYKPGEQIGAIKEPVFNDDESRIRYIVRLYERIVRTRNEQWSLFKTFKERRLIGDYADGFGNAYSGIEDGNGIGLCVSND